MLTIRDVVTNQVAKHGFDGLYNSQTLCRCTPGNLMFCGAPKDYCQFIEAMSTVAAQQCHNCYHLIKSSSTCSLGHQRHLLPDNCPDHYYWAQG